MRLARLLVNLEDIAEVASPHDQEELKEAIDLLKAVMPKSEAQTYELYQAFRTLPDYCPVDYLIINQNYHNEL